MSQPLLLLSLPASSRALVAVLSTALAPVDLPAVVQSFDTSEHDGGVESGKPRWSEKWMATVRGAEMEKRKKVGDTTCRRKCCLGSSPHRRGTTRA